jgi:uncharacterized protein YkwD
MRQKQWRAIALFVVLCVASMHIREVEATEMRGAPGAVALAAAPLASASELRMVELANADRARHGLAPFEFDDALLEVARARAAAQVGRGALSHDDDAGPLAFARMMDERGVGYALCGENLARVPATEASVEHGAQEALMKSPAHRDNILEPAFNRLAVGAATDPSGRVVFAQVFRAAP